MTVLVTGAGGFLGVHVVERLLARGCNHVKCFLRDPGKAARLMALATRHPESRLEFLYGNLRSKRDCANAVGGATLLVHLAAGLRGAPADLFADSVVASRNLLEALEERCDIPLSRTRVVLVSSCGVYGVTALPRGARVTEATPLEEHPELRDAYSHSKLRQEELFREHQRVHGFELVVLRPGVIYGPGSSGLSVRIGLQVGPLLLHLGGRNVLPLSYVVNCADAVALAALHPGAGGEVYNVHDDVLRTSAEFLREYRRHAKRIRSLRIPYVIAQGIAGMMESYNRHSQGQLPAVLTRYKTAAAWGGNEWNNAKLHSLGWQQIVPTPEAMAKAFACLSTRLRDGDDR